MGREASASAFMKLRAPLILLWEEVERAEGDTERCRRWEKVVMER